MQVIELQAQVRRLETELDNHVAGQHLRLAHCREIYFEATWSELELVG